ncbi:hypothetical protein DTO166G4_5965 [Paecilomyces variotii]|nr:hypothetical protein DTO166G4_5965 [Paecilomyces variotii]KAJ9254267.1 hypothetical protein DTO195F2_6771 [Paecilomyces variotii]KAJ9364580.1 hypothetical protein DTO280E4_1360 [Paecilomyces variotii]KAJ9372072.1 hypothetical protein DTO282E5_3165 [Paecilomyces variotii]KAJ9400709.1 hypothetical protein DTO282F9_2277 [Paecilomyces variotii]
MFKVSAASEDSSPSRGARRCDVSVPSTTPMRCRRGPLRHVDHDDAGHLLRGGSSSEEACHSSNNNHPYIFRRGSAHALSEYQSTSAISTGTSCSIILVEIAT